MDLIHVRLQIKSKFELIMETIFCKRLYKISELKSFLFNDGISRRPNLFIILSLMNIHLKNVPYSGFYYLIM